MIEAINKENLKKGIMKEKKENKIFSQKISKLGAGGDAKLKIYFVWPKTPINLNLPGQLLPGQLLTVTLKFPPISTITSYSRAPNKRGVGVGCVE